MISLQVDRVSSKILLIYEQKLINYGCISLPTSIGPKEELRVCPSTIQIQTGIPGSNNKLWHTVVYCPTHGLINTNVKKLFLHRIQELHPIFPNILSAMGNLGAISTGTWMTWKKTTRETLERNRWRKPQVKWRGKQLLCCMRFK